MLRIEITIHGNRKFRKDFFRKIISLSEKNSDQIHLFIHCQDVILESLKRFNLCNNFLVFEETRGIESGSNGNKIFIVVKDEGWIIPDIEIRNRLARTISEELFILTKTVVQCIIHPTPEGIASYQVSELMN